MLAILSFLSFYIKFYFKCEKCLRILQPVIIKNKESLQKRALEMYQNFPIEKKEKEQQYGWKGCKILPEDEKERLVEYRKNITKCEKCKGFTRKDWFYGC